MGLLSSGTFCLLSVSQQMVNLHTVEDKLHEIQNLKYREKERERKVSVSMYDTI